MATNTSKTSVEKLQEYYDRIEEIKSIYAEKHRTDEEMKKIWLVQERGYGQGVISRYKGTETDVVFPTEVAGIKIIGIANRSGVIAKNYPQLTSVIIPEGYERIGNNAFEGCTSLETVYIPTTVTEIGNEAFSNCSKLEMVVIPTNIRSLSYISNSGKWMFRDCVNLKDVYVLDPINEVGTQAAFRGCPNVTVHMEDISKLKITQASKHFAKITEEEKKAITKGIASDGLVDCCLTGSRVSGMAPKKGTKLN